MYAKFTRRDDSGSGLDSLDALALSLHKAQSRSFRPQTCYCCYTCRLVALKIRFQESFETTCAQDAGGSKDLLSFQEICLKRGRTSGPTQS